MGKEYELKFRATPEKLEEIQTALPGAYTLWNMRTDYYDTPEGDLSKRKWMIRCRKENDRSVCTLKTPGTGLERNEWETECADIISAIPVLAAESGHQELTALAEKGLVLRCGAAFTRKARMLEVDGVRVELALDQGVLMGGGEEQPIAEVELELKEGSGEALMLFARKFQKDFDLKTEHKSKFARAKALGQRR